ncbi:MAG TPA: NCS2 family permease [Patescibacteria group bacterium]|nr:NCS2 family permease [Patescibacteria group bacterium]
MDQITDTPQSIRPTDAGNAATPAVPWFVRGDVDGFFGLFLDNLLQLMVISVLGRTVCGFPSELIDGRILPGAALSILVGNLFYAWQARRLARRTGRTDVTALPYGINTPSVMAFIFLIMGPVYQGTRNPVLAWQAGLLACFLNGLMEIAGALCGDWLRKHTPRAALLSALSGVAITLIAMGFVFQLFANPIIGFLPMMLILVGYAARIKLPLNLPVGFAAVFLGTVVAWILRATGSHLFEPSTQPLAWHFNPPAAVAGDLLSALRSADAWKFLAVILPMGLFTVIGSLQNLESAEAAGDRYPTRSSLLANGVGTLCAACFGSAFPTTIYIGHPGWKAMGARSGYSAANGIIISALCMLGGVSLVLKFVPMEATLGILVWISIIITAQAFQETPKPHALAVALGLIPALATWALLLIDASVRAAGSTLSTVAPKFGADLFIYGAISLSQGFIITSMIFSAILALSIDRQLFKAALWAFTGAILSALGLIHAYVLTPEGVQNRFGWFAAPGFVLGYGFTGVLLVALHLWNKRKRPG